jgi:DNA-binding winged helix-turn-helix (wHTH) protein/tetratricopeptide (TPR) repeat protein
MGVFQPGPVRERVELANEPEFDLGGMKVKPAERLAYANGEQREIQPRVMQVLVALAKARPQVVSRDRLQELCWNGRIVSDDALNRVILSLRHLAQGFTPQPFAIETVPRVGHRLVELSPNGGDGTAGNRRRGTKAAIAAVVTGLVVLLVVAIVLGRPNLWAWETPARTPIVLVTAAANDGASQALAREFGAKLGSLLQAQSASMQLIGEADSSSGKPGLILEVGRIADPAAVGANIVLMGGEDRAILWSKEFEEASRNLADLKEQIAVTAAQVLGCALEGMEPSNRFDEQTLKLYITGCAQASEVGGGDPHSVITSLREVIAILQQVVDKAPRFKAAWAKLLLVEAKATLAERDAPLPIRRSLLAGGKPPTRIGLPQDIVKARELQPEMIEVLLAQSAMLPAGAYGETLELLDRAKQRDPENASVLAFRAAALMKVGRLSHAIADSKRAAELAPLSPDARSSYVMTLAYAGRVDAARAELKRAERLWPETHSLRELRYEFHWHFGDPMLALKLTPPGLPKGRELFLRARAAPTQANVDRFLTFIRAMYRRQGRTDIGRPIVQEFAAFHQENEIYERLLDPRNNDLSRRSRRSARIAASCW